MDGLSRRRFVAWLGAIGAALGVSRSSSAGPGSGSGAAAHEAARDAEPPFDEALLAALASAVLPSELGAAGIASAARRFADWIDGYTAGAEVLHPYGSSTIATLPPSPVPTWRPQLQGLDQSARDTYGRSFGLLVIADRQQLVRYALAGTTAGAMPAPLDAPHIAIALLAHFAASPEGTDLCYGAQIGKNRCRPLVQASRRPLARGGAS